MGLESQFKSEERAQYFSSGGSTLIGQVCGYNRKSVVSTATVNRFLANPENYCRKPRSDWPKKIRHLANPHRFSAPKIKVKLQLDCSVTTVKRNLASNHWPEWSKIARKPPLTADKMKACLRCAWDHVFWGD